MTSLAHPDAIHLGMDVHKDSISVGILNAGHESADVEKINDEESVRRLVARLPDPRLLRACYEAGPTGYDLHRLLGSLGVRCEVIAPVADPQGAGRQGQDRPAGLPAPGPPPPGRGAGGHPGTEPARGGGAGPVPHPG